MSLNVAIASPSGHLVKRLSAAGTYLFDPRVGIVAEDKLEGRLHARKRKGLTWTRLAPLFQFQITGDQNSFQLLAGQGCNASAAGDGRWSLSTPMGLLQFAKEPVAVHALPEPADREDRSWIWMASAAALLSLLFWFLPQGTVSETAPPVLEPVTVKVVQELQKSVKVPTVSDRDIPKELRKETKEVKRAIQQNLGFLGFLGKKELTKALGGMPTKLKDASPGAGAGGTQGSGGELLQGLGEGVKRTTVGSSGVAGLGGVGTKGAGGGQGGYGNSMIGSGEGKALSAIPLSQDLVLEGGLDRAVIQATIAKYLSQVRACYEEGLRNQPGLMGQVRMAFQINAQGMLNYARVAKSSLGHAGVESCISARMMTWKFPKPLGGVEVKVDYPFLLRPVGT